MKQLTYRRNILRLSIILLLACHAATAQRFLQISDDYMLDTRGAMSTGLHVFYDNQGFPIPITGEAAKIRVGLLKNTDTVAMLVHKNEFDNPNFAAMSMKFVEQQFLGSIITLMKQRENQVTGYGIPLKGKIMLPGDYDDSDLAHIRYSGKWLHTTTGCKCSYSQPATVGDYIEFTFSGTSVKMISEKVPTHGIVKIELDGQVVVPSLDLYAKDKEEKIVAFERKNLPNAQHTVRITITGKNPASGSQYFVLHSIHISDIFEPVVVKETVRDTVEVDTYLKVEVSGKEYRVKLTK